MKLNQLVCLLVFLITSQYNQSLPSPSSLPAACNPSACRASGRGLQPKGVRVKEVAYFRVHTRGAGSGELSVSVKGPSKTLPTWRPSALPPSSSSLTSSDSSSVFFFYCRGSGGARQGAGGGQRHLRV